jgi:hypothetical protein
MAIANVKTFWKDNNILNMREFHYDSPDLSFVAYSTTAGKIAFVFNNTINNLCVVKKLVIEPLTHETDKVNPIIKWDQIVKENFGINPIIIRPKNKNRYEKFDIDYVGLDFYKDLIRNPNNEKLHRDVVIFNIERNLISAYKREEVALLELNTSSKTIETTTKTCDKIALTIEKTNSKLEKLNFELETDEVKEEKDSNTEKLYKKLTEQKTAKRRLKRAKTRYVDANKELDIIRSSISNMMSFLKQNKVSYYETFNGDTTQKINTKQDEKNNNSFAKNIEIIKMSAEQDDNLEYRRNNMVANKDNKGKNSVENSTTEIKLGAKKTNPSTDIKLPNSVQNFLKTGSFQAPNWVDNKPMSTSNDGNKQSQNQKTTVEIKNDSINKYENIKTAIEKKLENKNTVESQNKSSIQNVAKPTFIFDKKNINTNSSVDNISNKQNSEIKKIDTQVLTLAEKIANVKNKIIEGTIGDPNNSKNSLTTKEAPQNKPFVKIGYRHTQNINNNPVVKIGYKHSENTSITEKTNTSPNVSNTLVNDNTQNIIKPKPAVFEVKKTNFANNFAGDKSVNSFKYSNNKTNKETISDKIDNYKKIVTEKYNNFAKKYNKAWLDCKTKINSKFENDKFKQGSLIGIAIIAVLFGIGLSFYFIPFNSNKKSEKTIYSQRPVNVIVESKSENTIVPQVEEETIIAPNESLVVSKPVPVKTVAAPKPVPVEPKVVKPIYQPEPEYIEVNTENTEVVEQEQVDNNSDSVFADDNIEDIVDDIPYEEDSVRKLIQTDANLIVARNEYVEKVIGYQGSVNRPLDIMMALGEAIVAQDDYTINVYINEVHAMNKLWNNFRNATVDAYYTQEDINILKPGVEDDLEIYQAFIDDEKLLRVYSDAHQNLMIIVRYMLDNYQNVVDENLFEEIKTYASMPEMLGYPVLKTKLIIDAYAQIRGTAPVSDGTTLLTNEEINQIYADNQTPLTTTKNVVLTNVNDPNDVIEAEVVLENVMPEKEYQIKVDVETNVVGTGTLETTDVVDVNVTPVLKGTATLDDVVNYEHNLLVQEEEENIDKNDDEIIESEASSEGNSDDEQIEKILDAAEDEDGLKDAIIPEDAIIDGDLIIEDGTEESDSNDNASSNTKQIWSNTSLDILMTIG